MRFSRLLSFAALLMIICSCTENVNKITGIPVKLEENGRTTIMESDGSTAEYDFKGDVSPVINGFFTVEGRKGLEVYRYDRKEAKIVGDLERLSWAGYMSEGLLPIRRKDDGKIEFVDATGEVKFSLGKSLNCVYIYSDGMMLVYNDDYKWGAINTKGDMVVRTKYDDISFFNEGVAAAQLNDKWMLIDKKGEKVCDLKGIDEVKCYMINGLIPAAKNDNWGFVNRKGEFNKIKKDLTIYNFNGKYAVVCDNENYDYGVVDTKGNIIVPVKYETILFYGTDNFLCQKDDDRWLMLDSDGEEKFSLRCEGVGSYKQNNTSFDGDFLVGVSDDIGYLYKSNGEKIADSKFYTD